jgi:hypothetical protein
MWRNMPSLHKDGARGLHTYQKRSIQIWTLKFIIEEIENLCAKFNYNNLRKRESAWSGNASILHVIQYIYICQFLKKKKFKDIDLISLITALLFFKDFFSIDPPHPLVCRKRGLYGTVLRMRPEKLGAHVTAGVAR